MISARSFRAVLATVSAVSAQFEPQVKDIVFAKKPDARLFDPAYLARFLGEYEMAGQTETATLSLTGNVLTVSIKGQPSFHLEPAVGGEFVIKEFRIISFVPVEDAKGNVTGARLIQPDGVYTLTKKK